MFYRCIVFLLLINSAQLYADVNIPAKDFGQGWKASGKVRQFSGDNLYGYINGGAELFKEYGFKSLYIQTYAKNKTELGLEVYEMTSPEAALGIYLAKRGVSNSHPDISSLNSWNNYQFTIVKNRFYVIIRNFEGDSSFVSDMIDLAELVLEDVQETETNILHVLPKENRIQGSEYIFRGPFALQPVYTFGEGDILQLKGDVFGVLADYRIDKDTSYTFMTVDYSDKNRASLAFENLGKNLDATNEVLVSTNNLIVFKDFMGHYSSINLTDEIISCKIKLVELPVIKNR